MKSDLRTGRIGRKNYPRLLEMIAAGMTAPQIADVFQVNQETVRKFARVRGLQIPKHPQDMERHPSWKNGTTMDKGGYIRVRVEKSGPYGYLIRAARKEDIRGYAAQHRVVMHDKLGRALLPSEVVHHIDGDPANNHPDNLEVFDKNADHLRETLKGKVPKWSAEGRAKMTGRPPRNRATIPTP